MCRNIVSIGCALWCSIKVRVKVAYLRVCAWRSFAHPLLYCLVVGHRLQRGFENSYAINTVRQFNERILTVRICFCGKRLTIRIGSYVVVLVEQLNGNARNTLFTVITAHIVVALSPHQTGNALCANQSGIHVKDGRLVVIDFACEVFVCSIRFEGVIVQVFDFYPVDRCFNTALTVTSIVIYRFIYSVSTELCNCKLGNICISIINVYTVCADRNATEGVLTIVTSDDGLYLVAIDILDFFTVRGDQRYLYSLNAGFGVIFLTVFVSVSPNLTVNIGRHIQTAVLIYNVSIRITACLCKCYHRNSELIADSSHQNTIFGYACSIVAGSSIIRLCLR